MNGRELGVAAETGPWPRDNAAPASLNPLAFRPPALPVNGADRRRCGLIVVHRRVQYESTVHGPLPENKMSKLSHKLALGAIVIAALAAGLVLGGMIRDDAPVNVESGAATQLERYEIGGEFELTNQRGERMRLSDLAGDAVVMFFGYTFCPDICPATLARMREVKAALPPEDAARFTGVLVSVDPARDTPQRLGQYVEFFDPEFIGLTGSAGEITEIARRYGAQFMIPEGQAEDGYLVNHSSIGYLIDPAGYVRALYYGDEPIEAIAANVREVIEELG